MNTGVTKLLIVDDSALYRQSITNVMREIPGIQIVGLAADGIEAIEKIEQLEPDLLTLDVQMPDMDGIEVLREIKKRRLKPKAIIVSSFTSEGAKVTTEALMEGAFDFILKPSGHDSQENRRNLLRSLQDKIVAFQESIHGKRRRLRRQPTQQPESGDEAPAPSPRASCQAVILGSSTGGPEALKTVLAKLPANLPVPVLVVQHMPAQYTASLAARLNDICELEVREAIDKTPLEAGQILIAPGGFHLGIETVNGDLQTNVNSDPPENGVRPSVDHTIRSACSVLNGDVLAVIMTGMGRDGLVGCQLIKQHGGYVYAQHQDDCVVYGMPKAVVEENLADRVLPLGKIAPAIVRHVKRSRRS